MSPRRASLRVAHQQHCPHRNQTALASIDAACRGAKCQPGYYTLHRDRGGMPVKGARVRDRRVAERGLHKLQRDLDEDRVGITRVKQIAFPDWCDEYLSIIDTRVRAGELKPGTKRAYKETLDRARELIGYVTVRELGVPELRRFYDSVSKHKPASRLRHLAHLNACLSAAVDEGYAEANPVRTFRKKLKLKLPKRGKAPFEDGELERLWVAMRTLRPRPIPPAILYLSRFSVETGARLGELIGADWTDVDLGARTFQIERTWSPIDGMLLPKDGEPRTVHMTSFAYDVLAEWIRHTGARDSGPLFPDPETGGRLQPRKVQRAIERAMTAAGIPKVHPTLHKPRSFHSLRYTTSNVLSRRGFHPRYIEQLLGHSSLELTYGVYGGWTPDQLSAEAARIPSA